MSTSTDNARESYRDKTNGQFGNQPHAEAEGTLGYTDEPAPYQIGESEIPGNDAHLRIAENSSPTEQLTAQILSLDPELRQQVVASLVASIADRNQELVAQEREIPEEEIDYPEGLPEPVIRWQSANGADIDAMYLDWSENGRVLVYEDGDDLIVDFTSNDPSAGSKEFTGDLTAQQYEQLYVFAQQAFLRGRQTSYLTSEALMPFAESAIIKNCLTPRTQNV